MECADKRSPQSRQNVRAALRGIWIDHEVVNKGPQRIARKQAEQTD